LNTGLKNDLGHCGLQHEEKLQDFDISITNISDAIGNQMTAKVPTNFGQKFRENVRCMCHIN